ncbi:MAG: DUF5518 domain-containing protein [Halobacteriota archaeon]
MREWFRGRTVVNGVVGAVVTVLLLPLPAVHFVAPLIGGVVASNLQDGGRKAGMRAAWVLSAVVVVPLFVFFFGVPPEAPTSSPVGEDPRLVYVLVAGASVWILGLSTLGGYLGGDVGGDASSGEASPAD